MSCRQACREVFGEKFNNVHRTLGNLYQKKYGESIGLAKKLSLKVRQQRRKELDEAGGVQLPRPGNPACQPYLNTDEEELIVQFLQTCNFMHMPFNRDAFKVSTCMFLFMHTHIAHTLLLTHLLSHTHTQGLIVSIALANGRHTNPVASDFYVREFLKRHPGLVELKTSNVGHHRAKQATAEVRDAVFGKLQVRVYCLLRLYSFTHATHALTCAHRLCSTALSGRMCSLLMSETMS